MSALLCRCIQSLPYCLLLPPQLQFHMANYRVLLIHNHTHQSMLVSPVAGLLPCVYMLLFLVSGISPHVLPSSLPHSFTSPLSPLSFSSFFTEVKGAGDLTSTLSSVSKPQQTTGECLSVCVCVCVCMCMYVHMHMNKSVISSGVCVCACVCMCTCI